VATHQGPDGDALGSALALAFGLKKIGKKVRIYNQDPVPSYLRFLPGSEQVSRILNEKERFDASFIVDCADLHRVGNIFQEHSGLGIKIVVDHHARSGKAGDLNFIDAHAASSGMVVVEVLKALRVALDRKIATNIYATIVADTGNFRYANVNAKVFETAKRMVEAGAVPWRISREIYERHPKERFRLLPRVIETLKLFFDDRVAMIAVTQDMLRQTGATRDMTEDFIEYPRSIGSVEVSVFLQEAEDGRVRVSLRSKESIDVSRIAAGFGGGGHARAAGCIIEAGMERVQDRLIKAIQAELEQNLVYSQKSLC